MQMNEELQVGPLELWGYEAPFQNGFALACFKSSERSNVWYAAECWPPQKKSGFISRFTMYDSEGIVQLSDPLENGCIEGGRWVNLFIWRNQIYSGELSQLALDLSGQGQEILRLAPISYFDLYFYEVGEEFQYLVKQCHRSLSESKGEELAKYWLFTCAISQSVSSEILELVSGENNRKLERSGEEVIEQLPSVYAFQSESGECLVRMSDELRREVFARRDVSDLRRVRAISDEFGVQVRLDHSDTSVDEIAEDFGSEVTDSEHSPSDPVDVHTVDVHEGLRRRKIDSVGVRDASSGADRFPEGYRISISSLDVDVGASLREFITDRIIRILSKRAVVNIDVRVKISQESVGTYFATIAMDIGKMGRVISIGESDRVYPAFEIAAERARKQLDKLKAKRRDKSRRRKS